MATETARDEILRVLAANPDLCTNGIRTRSVILGYEDKFDEWRADMLAPDFIAQFERGKEFLSRFPKTRTFNEKGTSYGLKHVASRFLAETGNGSVGDQYISNGMFIASALALGFKIKRHHDCPNVWFNISTHAWRCLQKKHPFGRGYPLPSARILQFPTRQACSTL